MQNFRVTMNNMLGFSECSTPDMVLGEQEPETLIVERRGDIMTVSDTGLFPFAENNRIYAKFVRSENGADIFTLLDKVPTGRTEAKPFLALEKFGSQATLKRVNGKLTLHLYGTDDGNGQGSCRGWVFDAVEV